MNPIEEQKTVGQRIRSSRFITDRLFAFKIAIAGLLVYIVGDVLESEAFMRLGIWVMVSALPIHLIGEVANFLFALKDADDEVKQAVSNTNWDDN